MTIDWLNIILLVIGSSGVAGIIVAFVMLPLNRKKAQAEITKILSDVEQQRIETLKVLQDELYETMEKYKKLFVELQQKQESNERLRAELGRLKVSSEVQAAELHNARTEALYLRGDIATMNASLLKKQVEADQAFSRIRDLEATVLRLRNDIVAIQKVTDKLVMPGDIKR